MPRSLELLFPRQNGHRLAIRAIHFRSIALAASFTIDKRGALVDALFIVRKTDGVQF